MEPYTLFIISSPLQLMNAIEAVHHFHLKNLILFILHVKNPRALAQMDKLKAMVPWSRVEYIHLPQTILERLMFVQQINRVKSSMPLGRIDRIFVGDYGGDHMNHIVNSFKASEVYLLDDGMVVSFYQQNQETSQGLKVTLRQKLYTLLGYKLMPIQHAFFSIYVVENAKVVENNYQFFRAHIQEKQVQEMVYFIGQPLMELGIVPATRYPALLQRVLEYYAPKKVYYIGHRNQERQQIEPMVEALGFIYREFSNPLELEMIDAIEIPSDFATFYSTALMTLPYFIDEANYTLFKLPLEDIDPQFVERIEEAYSVLQSRALSLVTL